MGTILDCWHLKWTWSKKIFYMLIPSHKGVKKIIKTFLSEDFFICRRCTLSCEYLRKFLKKFETALRQYSGAWGKLIHKKTWSRKILGTVPLMRNSLTVLYVFKGKGHEDTQKEKEQKGTTWVSRLTQVDGTVERQTDDRQTDIHTDRKKGKKDRQKDTVKKETRIDNMDEKGTPIKKISFFSV